MPAELLAAVRARALDHPRRARRGAARRDSSSCGSGGRSRSGTTRRSRPGTGLRSRRSPRPDGGSSGPTGSSARGALGEFLLGPLSDEDGRLRRSWRDGRTSGRRLSRRLRERRPRPARAARRHRRAPLAARGAPARARSRSTSSPTTSTAASSSSPAGGERLVARTKELDDHPLPSGNSMLAHVLLRLARIYGDDELERRAVARPPARPPGARARAVVLRLGALRARPPPEPAAGARRGRARRLGGRARGARAVAARHGRRCRPCGRRAAPGREDPRRRASPPSTSASGSRAGRRSTDPGGAPGGLRSSPNFPARPLSKKTRSSNLARPAGPLFVHLKGRVLYA